MNIDKDMALHILDGLAMVHVREGRKGGAPGRQWHETVEDLELIAHGSDKHFTFGETYQKFLDAADNDVSTGFSQHELSIILRALALVTKDGGFRFCENYVAHLMQKIEKQLVDG